ncbi:MAG TPA: hypothetical protein DCF91_00310 [Porphyromonadaceae bacterium]|nr:hypothetical protein [Porphyromonadaceae bacterium]
MRSLKRILFAGILFCAAITTLSAQSTVSMPLDGKCKDVIKSLRNLSTNDSIAIDIFKEDCKITNMPLAQKQALLKKNYKDIIAFFERKENAKYQCEPKKPFKRPDPVLLIE